MSKTITLAAETRQGSGTAAARRLRRAGLVPANLEKRKGAATTVQLNAQAFANMLRHHSGENLIIDLSLDGGAVRKVLLKAVQHDPVDDHAVHADFVEISMTEKLKVRIPLVLRGEPVGVSQEGGILEHLVREIEVACLPADLIDRIEIDVSGLKLGQSLRVKDVAVDPKLTVLTAAGIAVAAVLAPRAEEEEAPPAAAEGAEPEVIGEKKEEGEGEEGAAKEGAKEGAKGKGEAKGKEEAKAPAKEAPKGKGEAKPAKEGKA